MTIQSRFERIARTAQNNSSRVSRAAERVARLAATKEGREASRLYHLANALNEHRHAINASRIVNSSPEGSKAQNEAIGLVAEHCRQRQAELARAAR
jgi:hypothetical protein